jgi:hypothetical protein
MPAEKDNAVLAARVLSYLKRKFGHGPQPSAAEAKAAAVAVTLLSKSFPDAATDGAKMFEKLTQVSRKGESLDSMSEMSQLQQMRLQMYMDKRQQMFQMLSNLMKKQNDTSATIIGNIR